MAAERGGPTSRADEVYARLHERIISGEYRPNERLVETEVAARLGASRTPVREALQRLEADGHVVTRRRSWTVREHTPEEIESIYEIRMALEGYAARMAATRATEAELRRIEAIQEGAAGAVHDGDRSRLVAANTDFHEAVVEAAHNPRLTTYVRRNATQSFTHRIARRYSAEQVARSLDGHAEIVAALVRHDGPGAEEATHRHLQEGLRTLLRLNG